MSNRVSQGPNAWPHRFHRGAQAGVRLRPAAKIIEQLSENGAPLRVGRGQSAAVLFVDMVNSTAFFSRMEPEEVLVLLRDLMALLSDCVLSRGGTIDKFLGDGLMAVFGGPLSGPADVTNAARCALDILRSIDRWNVESGRSQDDAVHVAIGIHHAQIVQGDIGARNRLELTVVGETVTLPVASKPAAGCSMRRCWSQRRSSMHSKESAAAIWQRCLPTSDDMCCEGALSRSISTA